MKNKKLIAVLALVLILVAGFASAYMRKQTQTIENDFRPPNVSCRVNENFDGTYKSDITITNTGNYKAYVRLRIVSYWLDEKGEIIFRESDPVDISSILNSDDWVADIPNNTYYYKKAIDPSVSTNNLLKNGTTIQLKTEGEYTQVVDIFAEAILAALNVDEPAKTVVTAWGVTVDGSGNIISA